MIVLSNFQIMFEVYVFTKKNLVCLFPMNILLYAYTVGHHFLNIVYVYNTIEIWETDKVNFFIKFKKYG